MQCRKPHLKCSKEKHLTATASWTKNRDFSIFFSWSVGDLQMLRKRAQPALLQKWQSADEGSKFVLQSPGVSSSKTS